eukprot:TRINITY_DN22342_c0_g1_i1.p1 TRINITY_DN22342_c0_g1~~TRINITY_DN22342_c0_g1_i1.p1  ORF type:complete len:358 (-),score=62.72 TRINITY_DN22342_c0_g1_i1:236-1282(-)
MTFSSLLANHNPMKDLELPNCPDDSISMIKFSPNANYLLCGSWDNTVRCWEVAEAGSGLKAKISHDAPVLSCCWHSDGTKAFTTGCDNYAKLWDLATNQTMNVAMHESPIKSVHWIEGKSYSCLMTGSWDKTLKFWDTRSSTPQLSLQLPERCYCIDVVYPLCVVGTAGRGVVLYSLENQPTLLKQIDSPLKYQHRCVSIFSDKDKPSGFALGSIEGRVAIHYINTPNPSVDNFTFKCHRSAPPQNSTQIQDIYVVNDISVHPVHGTLATVGSDCKFSYWDKNARTKLKTSEPMLQPIVSCDFNFNGQIFGYAVSYDWSKGHEKFDPSKKNYIFLRKADEDLKPRKKR